MAEIKLSRIPDRSPVKIKITVLPELAEKLEAYADAYQAAYGKAETVADLIPYMLASFLESDRAFARSRARP